MSADTHCTWLQIVIFNDLFLKDLTKNLSSFPKKDLFFKFLFCRKNFIKKEPLGKWWKVGRSCSSTPFQTNEDEEMIEADPRER